MKTVTVNTSTKYDILIGTNLLAQTGEKISSIAKGCKNIAIVSDSNVFPFYGKKIITSLEKKGFKTNSFVFESGEKSKTLKTYGEVQEFFNKNQLTRNDIVVALGGGVVGDLAGFAAATYQRGIRFVQIPTTLLAQVDASVGGKTAVNLSTAKNQVGCFYQPTLVLCDTDTLSTLPAEEYRCGCAEVIKYAILHSEDFFNLLMETPIENQFEKVIFECVQIKRNYVERDEFDTKDRMFLNLGHTFGHAIEACSKYTIPHGQAVAIGMAIMVQSACSKEFCSKETQEKIISALGKYNLPTTTNATSKQLKEAIVLDKKLAGDNLTIVVPHAIGNCALHQIKLDEIIEWIVAGGIE